MSNINRVSNTGRGSRSVVLIEGFRYFYQRDSRYYIFAFTTGEQRVDKMFDILCSQRQIEIRTGLFVETMNQLSSPLGCSKECYGFRGPPFPQKLFAAIDSPNALIQWTENGKAISVDADEYERNVMHVHPGLVEISSFANFRRQMREYGFDWLYHDETHEFEFSHPSFLRGRPDLLPAVLTRRKRRRKHGVAFSTGTRLHQSASVPHRRSVISYAGVPKRDSDRPRTCGCGSLQTSRNVGTAKSLNEMTDEEWWTYCAPAITLGMNAVKDEAVSGECATTEHRFVAPLFFYTDDTAKETDKAARKVTDFRWTQRVLDFDEL